MSRLTCGHVQHMYSWWCVRLWPETCRVKALRRIKTQLLHLVGLISPIYDGQSHNSVHHRQLITKIIYYWSKISFERPENGGNFYSFWAIIVVRQFTLIGILKVIQKELEVQILLRTILHMSHLTWDSCDSRYGPIVGFCERKESVNPGCTNPGRKKFSTKILSPCGASVGPRCGICFMPHMWPSEFSDSFYIFEQFIHSWP